MRGEVVGGEHSRSERTLSVREFKALLKSADPGRLKIKKTRRAFLWHGEYYLLDTFHAPAAAAGTTTLFVEAPRDSGREAPFPPFLKPRVDVTAKKWFSSKAHDSYELTIMMADAAADAADADAAADPRRGSGGV